MSRIGMTHRISAVAVATVCLAVTATTDLSVSAANTDAAASGARVWVDPKTPPENYGYTTSRGQKWELVMSDEFDTPGRTFEPGADHMWTAIESPDGVNNALEYYSIKEATTECQGDVVCYLKINVNNVPTQKSVWNADANPPGMQTITYNYTSAMLQSWNKFCFQGGMVEVRLKLPGVVGPDSKNPDLARGALAPVKNIAFYPTWPGVWMMGNLGRALFAESTTRMWPYSYNKCEPSVFDPANQRISACNASVGSGMNPKQGRGAPEIDILEGGGTDVSASLQIAPGMPTDFRRVEGESDGCFYNDGCQTLGANDIGAPSKTYDARGHRTWYQKLKYAFNPFCLKNSTDVQTLDAVQASLDAGITANKCDTTTCPASLDVNSDLTEISGTNNRWGVNVNGNCFAKMNVYQGSLLCSQGNQDPECLKVTKDTRAPKGDPYKYRLDAVSANWPIHTAMYTDFLAYQVEWVPGSEGYIRWMLEGKPIYEIPADAIVNPPQDSKKSNPVKILPEEPMYLIFNVAVSSAWVAEPPNAPRACGDHGNIKDADTNGLSDLICSQFPLDMKIDYVRVYQDVSSSSKMSVGCDPASHPTKQWIKDHIKEYQNDANPVAEVAGKAMCKTDNDCTVKGEKSGVCASGRCSCLTRGGPRCTSGDQSGLNAGSSGSSPSAPPSSVGSGGDDVSRIGTIVGIGAGALVALILIIYAGRKVRMHYYYKSEMANSDRSFVAGDVSGITSYPREQRVWSAAATPAVPSNNANLGTINESFNEDLESDRGLHITTNLQRPD